MQVKTKTLPRLLLDRVLLGYKKHNVNIVVGTQVPFHDVNCSGGTKSEYRAYSIDGTPTPKQPDMGMAPPWANPYEGATVELPPNVIIVRTGWFCGKASCATIYVHPDNMARLLPAPV